jgi:hypothetical protein
MDIVHILSVTIVTVGTTQCSATAIHLAALLVTFISALVLGPPLVSAAGARLKHVATKIYSRMQALGLNETELSEQCSLAAVHMFDDHSLPALTRDRISKILMNRQEIPAKSAAKVITDAELAVLGNVLSVSLEWLVGQELNRDPVVWNVLAQPDRVQKFTNLLQEYEEMAIQTTVWSQYPMHVFTSDAFSHAFNHAHYGQKSDIGNTRPLIEFANSVDRIRRKWLLRTNRTFEYANLVYQSDFEHAICGQGFFSAISRTILIRNIDVMVERISNPALLLKLIILKDENSLPRTSALANYEILAAVDTMFSVWTYHNCDVGWSEHPTYVNLHNGWLNGLRKHYLFEDTYDIVEYLKSLRNRIAKR